MTVTAERGDPAVNPRRIVVVAGEHDADARKAARVGALLRRCSAAIDELSAMRACSMWLRSDQIEHLGALQMSGAVPAAAVLLGMRYDRAARVQTDAARRGLAVLTDHDASAIALSAATLLGVNRRRRGTGAAQVLIAGANRSRMIAPLLTAVGVGQVTLWNVEDAPTFPLSRLVETTDVVINLLDIGNDADAGVGSAASPTAADDGDPVFLAPHPVADSLLVLPALVWAMGAFPDIVADPVEFELLYHDMAHACALELVMASASNQTALPRSSRELSMRLAHAAARSLSPRLRHPSAGRASSNGRKRPGTNTGSSTENV